jgi:hypothetical protein
MIDYESVVPLYRQVSDSLQEDIASGVYEAGTRLPTEGELSECYRVSRITVRRAVEELCNQGLIEKKQGKGTFVRSPKFYKNLGGRTISFTEMCQANGMKASAQLLSARVVTLEEKQVMEMLKLPKGVQVVEIVRLRFADAKPIAIETNCFPMDYAYLLNVDLNHDSMYRYLREEKKINIFPGKLVLRIAMTNAKESRLLEVKRNTPMICSIGYAMTDGNKVLHTIQNIGYGENFDFIVR